MEKIEISHHISRQFNEELETIRSQVLTMGGLVEQQITNAVTALVEGDTQLAFRMITRLTDSKSRSMKNVPRSSRAGNPLPVICV